MLDSWQRWHCSRIFSKFLWFYFFNHQPNISSVICHSLHEFIIFLTRHNSVLRLNFHAFSLTHNLFGYRGSKFHYIITCLIFKPTASRTSMAKIVTVTFILIIWSVYINNLFVSFLLPSHVVVLYLVCKLMSNFASCIITIAQCCWNLRWWI
jgi:hypothetical protein